MDILKQTTQDSRPGPPTPAPDGRLPALQTAVIAVLIFVIAWGAAAWRIDGAPDLFTDEILYTRLGIRVAEEGALLWDSGKPIFVHPPIYFLVESVYLSLTADPASALYTSGDIFAWVYHARLLNVTLAALTAALLFLLGRQLKNARLGVFLVLLFVLDPFALRINRRAMLETLAALLSVLGMTLFWFGHARSRRPLAWSIWAGLVMGLGLLTKELSFTSPLAVLLFGLWQWRRGREPGDRARRLAPFSAAGIAFLSYGLMPIWALTTGRWDRFASVKLLSLRRLVGLVHTSGWNRPGVTLLDFLLERVGDYGSTYLLLALGVAATVALLLFVRRSATQRLLAVWGLVLYPFYGAVALFGSGNDQFFYFLLLPAMILIGYVLVAAHDELLARVSTRGRLSVLLGRAPIALLVLILPYNAFQWVSTYGTGTDNGYHQLAEYVQNFVPAGEPINASGDPLKFEYFFPNNPITHAGTPAEARQLGVRYLVLVPKDLEARYGAVTPELAAWLLQEGEQQFAAGGESYGDIHLYYVDGPPGPEAAGASFSRTFPAAGTGFVGPFLLGLSLWLGGWLGASVWLYAKPRPRQPTRQRRPTRLVRQGEPE